MHTAEIVTAHAESNSMFQILQFPAAGMLDEGLLRWRPQVCSGKSLDAQARSARNWSLLPSNRRN
jgi:hypothetical protein